MAEKIEIQDYADWTGPKAVYPGKGTGNLAEIGYLTLSLCGETGELANVIKKALRRNQDIVQGDAILAGELGDIFWYLCRLTSALGFDIDEVLRVNMEKIEGREATGTIAEHD